MHNIGNTLKELYCIAYTYFITYFQMQGLVDG